MLDRASQINFAHTKIQPPRLQSGLIARAALEGRLHAAMAVRRLTLLQVPAGWGKTSLLTRVLSQLPAGRGAAWIAADEDDDLQRFLACLSSALEPMDLAWRVSPRSLPTLALGERGLRQVADEITNALASYEIARGVIVIDDAHRIRDPRVFELLRLLLESMPVPHWGLVIATRTTPDLPLARWRARDEVAELRLDDLRFDTQEVADLLAASGAAPQAASELAQRTGGWAAGLRLLMSVGGGSTRAVLFRERHVFEYLADEVLSALDPQVREFLLRCSVLPELTPRRCAHVAQQPRAAVLLERLEADGLFLSALEAEEPTLRLHDLFRDFLEDRLQRDHPDEIPGLLQRAADHEPDLSRAIGWLARAGAWERAAHELAARAPALVSLGGGPTIERLLKLFPEKEQQHRPDLNYLRALCAYQQFDFEILCQQMQQAAAGYLRKGQHEEAVLAQTYAAVGMRNSGRQEEARVVFSELNAQPLSGSAAAIAAYFSAWEAYADHQPQAVAPAFSRALGWLEQIDDPRVWEQCFMHCFLLGCPGMAPLVARFDECAMQRMPDTPSLLSGSVLHSRAAAALGAGDLGKATEFLAAADEDVRWLGHPRTLATENYMLHLAIDALRGDGRSVEHHLQRMRTDMSESGDANRRTHSSSALLAAARAVWLLADHAQLQLLERQMMQAQNSFDWRYADVERKMVQGMVALDQGRNADAVTLLGASLTDSVDEDIAFFRNSQARLLLAAVHLRSGDLRAAEQVLRPWLRSAHEGGFVGGAMMAGRPILQQFVQADWQGLLARPDLALISHLCDIMSRSRSVREGTSARAGGLTDREWQVLERIAAGDSNKLIARALDLSLFTVKRHVANIFDKLALGSRTQAAVWLREQGGAQRFKGAAPADSR
ncbi:MAG: AAA family ATPase [Sinobacteraceae bacterium]|nr:AAA family ATPase [Nevskiaceae bacterium]